MNTNRKAFLRSQRFFLASVYALCTQGSHAGEPIRLTGRESEAVSVAVAEFHKDQGKRMDDGIPTLLPIATDKLELKNCYLSYQSMLNTMKTIIFTLTIILTMAPANSHGQDGKMAATGRYEIFSGRGELPFDRAYGLKISLPVSEAEFLAILDNLRLHCHLLGRRGTQVKVPPPLHHPEAVNLTDIEKCYQIYGRKPGETYRAYIDTKHRVVYIENAFSYAIP